MDSSGRGGSHRQMGVFVQIIEKRLNISFGHSFGRSIDSSLDSVSDGRSGQEDTRPCKQRNKICTTRLRYLRPPVLSCLVPLGGTTSEDRSGSVGGDVVSLSHVRSRRRNLERTEGGCVVL